MSRHRGRNPGGRALDIGVQAVAVGGDPDLYALGERLNERLTVCPGRAGLISRRRRRALLVGAFRWPARAARIPKAEGGEKSDHAGDDQTFLDRCVDAVNDRCWYYRSRAGYQDHPNVAPGNDVILGVIMYAAQLYRQRGAVDGYASFDAQGFGVVPQQSLGQILALLGCKRPGVG